MLFIDSRQIEVIPAKDGIVCSDCKERVASYKMEPRGGGEWVPFCGWCVLYGNTKWGYENRDELAWAGRYVQREGKRSLAKHVVVPMLDEIGRLHPAEAERYVMGILFTSKLLEKGRALVRQAREDGAKVIRLFNDD
jgi:hypothetical protein